MPEYEDEEASMSLKKYSVAIAVAGMAAFATTGAFADEPVNTIGCLHLAKKVSDALSANQQSPNYQDARNQESTARQFCMSGVYDQGMWHYRKALEDLGADKN